MHRIAQEKRYDASLGQPLRGVPIRPGLSMAQGLPAELRGFASLTW